MTETSSNNNNIENILSRFTAQMERLDALETKIETKTARLRRRVANVLEEHYSSEQRDTHVRIWASHKYNKASLDPNAPTPETFRMQLEGCLLIGHLDHESAAAFDKKTGYAAPADDGLDRSKGEKEEDII